MALPAMAKNIKYSINEAWKFALVNNAEAYKVDIDDKGWEVVSFPHTWNNKDAVDEVPGFFRGEGWYRKQTYIGDVAKDKTVYLYFEGANQTTDVYVNQKHVGTHKGGYGRFSFDITPYIKVGEKNSFAFKVDNSYDKMIPPLSADFTFFGGIYRDVYLQIENPVHISLLDKASSGTYITTPEVSEKGAAVEVKTLLNNHTASRRNVVIEYTILSPRGTKVGQASLKKALTAKAENIEMAQKFSISNPELWSTDTPQLYTLLTAVKDAKTKEVLDESQENFGLRWFSFDADKGFFLNGKHLKLIGTSRHQCFLGMGNALDDQLHIRDVQLLKDMGGNFLRIAHYPQDPLVLEMCDKLGLITSIEIPIINAITEDQEFLDNSLYMMDEMMKQNFNHPSLVLWTYMNEVMLRLPYKQDSEEYKAYAKEVNRHAEAIEKSIRALDPYRYTQIPFHAAIDRYADAGLVDIPMTVGLNLYSGWYNPGIENIEKDILDFKSKYPTVPITISEYGADVDVRIHSEKPERFDFSVEFGDLFHEHYLKTFLKHDFVAGTNIWNLNDFHSEIRTDAIPRINSKGITGLDRTPKNTYWLYKATLVKEPFMKIASADWKYRTAQDAGNGTYTQKVKVYSNQALVDLYHNGKLVSKVKLNNHVGEADVAFQNGVNTLEARVADINLSDIAEVHYTIIPQVLDNSFTELNVLLGTDRMFEDKTFKTSWIPEKEYAKGSWGYVGGERFRAKTGFGSLPAADLDVLGTDKDPIFQTQRVDIESFKADVANGKYAVYLYWADFNRAESKEVVAYNLGNDRVYEKIQPRVFDVAINNQKVLENYDIPNEVGTGRAIVKKFDIDVNDNEGLSIDFTPVEGNVILNAIRIVKKN